MRKVICTFCVLILLSLCVSAATGDIAGYYYATDIKTFLNGFEIDAINIGGETLISAESMDVYGFAVYWFAEERMLEIIETNNNENIAPVPVVHRDVIPGTPVGNYYETDIVTTLNGKPVIAYNIGGLTYIHAEKLRDCGYDVIWYPDERKLDITSPKHGGYVYDIPLSYSENRQDGTAEATGAFSVKYSKDGIVGIGDADYFDMTMHSNGEEYVFDILFYQYKSLFKSQKLLEQIGPLCYDGYLIDYPCDKSEKYAALNDSVSISINGQRASKVSVIYGAGNGHRDFYFTAEDLPKLKKNEINEIVFTFGNPTGESYEIKLP